MKLLLISFSNFLLSLKAIGVFVAGIIMMVILSDILKWLWNTVVIGLLTPILGHRAYYYVYKGDGLYSEKFLRFLGFKMPRNKKWAVHFKLAGFVRKPFISNRNHKAADIFTRSFGLNEQIGVGKFVQTEDKGKIAEIFIKRTMRDGSSGLEKNPVGYVNTNGVIYKYYKGYNESVNLKKLEHAEEVAICTPTKIKWLKKRFSFDTNGERDDLTVVDYIDKEEEEPQISPYVSWNAIRKNKPLKKKVVSAQFESKGTEGLRPLRWLFIWRYIDAIPLLWRLRAQPFGFGFSRKNFNWFSNSNLHADQDKENNIPLIYIACAALILAEKEGFYRYEEETTLDPTIGWNETVIVSLLAYLLMYPLWLNMPWFPRALPFLGPELSQTVLMSLSFFVVWAILHFLYNSVFERPKYMKITLNMLNNNTGTLSYSRLSIVLSLVGIILTILYLPFTLFPMFLSVIIALSVNRVFCPQIRWDVDEVFRSSGGGDTSESDKEETEGLIEREYKWKSQTSLYGVQSYNMNLFFSEEKIEQLRDKNPFKTGLGLTPNYPDTVKKMLSDNELEVPDEKGLPALQYILAKLDRGRKNTSVIETILHYLNFVQETIKYKVDSDCTYLQPIRENKEYCRFSRETLFDKEGDCDCKSALAAALLAQKGFRIAYLVSSTHAFIGVSKQNIKSIWDTIPRNAVYSLGDEEEFLCFETTGGGWTMDSSIINSGYVQNVQDIAIIEIDK